MTPTKAAREVRTTRSRKKPTGTADITTNTSKVRAAKGWRSKYWPTGDFMKATTCGQRRKSQDRTHVGRPRCGRHSSRRLEGS